MTVSKKIMVVDDNSDHLLISKLVLERRGYEVLTLKDCDDLLNEIRLFQPAVIFMDHDFPGMSGVDATRLIKDDVETRHIPVIFFSSRVDIKDLAAQAGADGCLSKPFQLEELVRIAGNY